MYNKIAPIILNSGKTPGASAVFIAQPDADKERLAGKIFLLAEIGGKKSDGEKIINFLIEDLEENYYLDEKIQLIGKIEGLRAENIFEAALAKTNRNLNEFLSDHKIKINPDATSITLGVVYQNKLHFAGFGKNRSLLIYRREDLNLAPEQRGYEIINVETDAQNAPVKGDEQPSKNTGLFSSVISGEVPFGSYFIFTSESLPEYLSSREMVEIITKLPPIVASEQIKNVLSKINSYVPFLGVIIKNTTDRTGKEIKEASQVPLSAQNSISSLNYTEQKTENMLAPAGLISWEKVNRIAKNLIKSLKPKAPLPPHQPISSRQQAQKEAALPPASDGPQFRPEQRAKEKTNIFNLPGANSFLRPQKIFLKKAPRHFLDGLKRFLLFIPNLFRPSVWRNWFSGMSAWFKSLRKKHLFLLVGLVVVVLVLTVSLRMTNNQRAREEAQQNFQALIEEIEKKEVLIDSHLLYNNEDGAARVLADAKAMIEALPRDKDYQIEAYEQLKQRLSFLENKTLKIAKVEGLEEAIDLSGLEINNLIFANGQIYGAGGNAAYLFNLETNEPLKIEAIEATNLRAAKFDDSTSIIHYRDNDKIFRLDTKTNRFSSASLSGFNEADDYGGFGIYNQRIYLISRAQNQLFLYPNSLTSRSGWIKETADISQAVDLFIDGDIYFLSRDSSIKKYRVGKSESYTNRPLDPPTNGATKLLGDTQQLYILDSANNRLAIINKANGALVSQRMFDNLPDIKDFALDAENRTIYLLAGDKIYKLSL